MKGGKRNLVHKKINDIGLTKVTIPLNRRTESQNVPTSKKSQLSAGTCSRSVDGAGSFSYVV